MSDTAIDQMTFDQTRAAAQELLDSTTGDLTGPDAERFEALTARARDLRKREEIATGAASGRFAVEGEGRSIPGWGQVTGHTDTQSRPAYPHRDAAVRTLDRHVTAGTLPADAAETVQKLMDTGPTASRSWTARWAAEAGSEDYRTAFAKRLIDPDHGHLQWSERESAAWRTVSALQSERAAMSLTDSAGGFLVPLELDPSVRLTGNGSTVPLLQIARVIPTTSDVWNGITSAGTTAEWLAEASEAAESTVALASPAIPNYKLSAFTPYSVELEGDAANLLTELGMILFDAAEQLLATAITTGSGSGQPTGIITALAASSPSVIVSGDGSEALAASDFFKLQNALGPRFQPNASWMMSLPILNTGRQFETANGSLRFPALQTNPPSLLGRPVYENSVMDSALNAAATESNYVAVYGDFRQFVVTARVGTQIELVPHIFGSSRRPTGQRGAWLWGRYGSDSLIDNAFRLLNIPTTA